MTAERDARTLQLLHRLILPLDRVLQVADRATGHGSAQLSALAVIHYVGASSLSALAEIERISIPTASRLVDGLVRAGLVERYGDDADRRVVCLRATPKGQDVVKTACDRRALELARAINGLDADEWAALGTTVHALNRVFRYDQKWQGG